MWLDLSWSCRICHQGPPPAPKNIPHPGKREGVSHQEAGGGNGVSVQIYDPIGVRCSACGLGTPTLLCVSLALKPKALGQFGCPTVLTKSHCVMIQVQMSLQDPDFLSLQVHLGCETPGLRPGRREAGGQEAWERGS